MPRAARVIAALRELYAWPWFEPLVLTLLLAVWFGYELGGRALWSPDEGRYAEIPREMVASGDYLTPRLNGVKYFENRRSCTGSKRARSGSSA